MDKTNRSRPQIVLITGTTSGVGQALQQHELANGKTVIAVNRREVKTAHPQLRSFVCHIESSEDVSRLFAHLAEQALMPDTYFLNAGITEIDNDPSLDVEVFDKVLNTNLYGVLTFVQEIQRRQLRDKTIVAISSTSIIVPNLRNLGYFISKLSIAKVFDLLRYSDETNRYKYVVLGPVASQLNVRQKMPDGISKKVFDFLTKDAQVAALQISRFAQSSARTLGPGARAFLIYHCLKVAVKIIPQIYYRPNKY